MKIAVLSNYTADMISWNNALTTSHYKPEIKFGGYNQVTQDLFENSWLKEYNPDVLIVLLASWGEPVNLPAIEGGLLTLRQQMQIPVILVLPEDMDSFNLVNEIHIISMVNVLSHVGLNEAYDWKLYYSGKYAYSRKTMEVLAEKIVNRIDYIFGNTKKVIVTDLDNTLWKGVIGEEGVDNISICDVYKDVQKALKKWKDKGVLLVSCSKNNPGDVVPVWDHPDMILKEDDFVHHEISWANKAQAIDNISKELNLGVSSFVFLDDNPMERAVVSGIHPEVKVLEFEDICDVPFMIHCLECFHDAGKSEDDEKRTEMYRTQKEREEEMKSFDNLDEYLSSLHMKIHVKKHTTWNKDFTRIVQLLNKTNQFNLMTNRYDEKEFYDLWHDEELMVYSLSVEDKFGDLGVVGVCVVKYIGNDIWAITDFVLSCRAMGRNVESQFLLEVMKDLIHLDRHEGVKNTNIKTWFRKTEKNIPCKSFWKEMGFSLTEASDAEETYFWEGRTPSIDKLDYIEVWNEVAKRYE